MAYGFWGSGPGICGYGYSAPTPVALVGSNNSFALIVVLFILLIIIGTVVSF